ncbi:MAG: STAS domain-containing protein [Alteromonadaceae bacterium]|nr:STAS domain-containing protein [Alteromonadaceae bacterium]
MNAPAPRVALEGQTLAVSGEVDADSVIALRKAGERLISQATGPLTVDLSALATAHSAVLSMLLCWQRLAIQRSLQLAFRGGSERLVSLAALSNLDDQIPGFAVHG